MLESTAIFRARAVGRGTAAKEHAAAKEFVQFLASPAAAAVIKAQGMEPN
jgi:ABC-type molybdate transport system substrate-binding protein